MTSSHLRPIPLCPAFTHRFILSPPRCPSPSASPVFSSLSPTRPAGSDADADTSRVIRTVYTSGYNFTPAQNGFRAYSTNPCHLLPNLSPLSRHRIAPPPTSAPRLLLLLLPIPPLPSLPAQSPLSIPLCSIILPIAISS
jgi:hypothetical protein